MMKVVYNWGKRHEKVFVDFVAALNLAKIDYFVLRNYEGLPQKNNSKDIDIIVRPGSYKKVANILLNCFKNNGIKNYNLAKFERTHCWVGIDLENDFFIHIDLIEGYLNKGFEIFSFDTLYSNTIDYSGFRVLNKSYDAVMLLLYKVIGVSELKEKYRNKISEIYKSEKEKIDTIFREVFDKKYCEEIISHLETEDYDWFVQNSRELSIKSKRKAFREKPIFTTINCLRFLGEKFYRIVICPKKYKRIIAVEAPDGAGKTTFIESLRYKMAECFVTEVSNVHEYHFRPTLLPNLGELGEKAGVIEQDKDFTNPHRGKKTSIISSIFRISYYILDYIVGGAIFIRKDVQFGKYTIFDRYVYDFIVDPKRSKINLPYSVRKFFCRLAPKPQITFVLSTDSHTIYKRKQELTVDEIERQLVEFAKLEGFASGYCKLDAGKATSEIVNDAMKVIVHSFTHKLIEE